MYPEELVVSMERELIEVGFKPLKTAEAITDHMEDHRGVTLLFINSMCGCVGTGARLSINMALAASSYRPDHLVTVFAGVDERTTAQVFTYTKPYPPSSPAIALFRDGELVYFVERHQIRETPPEIMATQLQDALETYGRLPTVAQDAQDVSRVASH
ncbi:MAG: BrxA/BrxB family bacilliredoxin [Amoebophilaceae bacterium]|jgi:putative YphP/YqiW family bacilliredoxin|nr:BrxA/BrxB family bacilliredoxin [Amoebophilaceae bacterium]